MSRSNPFFHRGPITERSGFFGRKNETDDALNFLRNAQSLSVIGPRRIGKSSFLLHISDPRVLDSYDLPPEEFCFVYADCGSWTNLTGNELYSLLLTDLGNALTATRSKVVLPDPAQFPGSYRALDQSAEAVYQCAIRVVILLDDYDDLAANRNLGPEFYSGLRGLATRYRVSFVTASTLPLSSLHAYRQNVLTSPFFNFLAQLRLGLFLPDEETDLLREQARQANNAFAPGTMEFLADLAGPHPLLLQIAGYIAYDLGGAEGLEMPGYWRERVTQRFETEAEPYWAHMFNRLSECDRKLLATPSFEQSRDREGLRRLEHQGLIFEQKNQMVPLSSAFERFVAGQTVPGLLQAPPLILDTESRIAYLHGSPLSLTKIEFDLLAYLVAHAGQIVSWRDLEKAIWQDDVGEDPTRLKAKIKTLRQALGDDADLIRNERGIGYGFQVAPAMLHPVAERV